MDIEIYRKFFGSIAKPQRSGKVFSNCESVPPIDGDTVTNRYPMQSGHEAMTVRIPIQSPDMAEAESLKEVNRIHTLDESITETADSGIKKRVRIDTRLDEMSTPEADRATKAEGGEEQPRYMRQQGESLKDYLHRTRTDIFLFLREALKPTELTPAQELKIVEELREAYQVMWQGQRVPRKGRYLIKSECERVLSALDGAIL